MNFNYPDTLPVSQMREEIIETIRQNQVTVIAGETGSGKTTQLPKMCLELLLQSGGRVGCTQPRRIAAMTVSARVAEELGESGIQVGYKIRFQDRTNNNTRIKFMTDGVLLAESRNDRMLRQYDILIIDEAHERSLNIDFLLGLVKSILPKRPDLKIIITSATIDTIAFSKHFDDAPIVSVSGTTYPVEIRYSPPESDEFGELENYIEAAVNATGEIFRKEPPGDMLVFMPTERDIRTCCDLLRKKINDAEILPLFGRLHTADQKKIFKPARKTKIVVATNVAETSITVPGIRYVVDTGLARLSFYNYRSKTTSLPIQRISRSSCDQRKGRCGRVGPGLCIRLFDEEDYLARQEFSIPEIKRSNLAEVILQMLSFELGDPYTFPFLDPPLPSAIKEGYNNLIELGAINKDRKLTAIGKKMASLPIDPCISRIIIEAKNSNCLQEIMVIATALAIQDPRVRPAQFEQQADKAHEQFIHSESDFLTLLNIWRLFHSVKEKTSWSRLKKFCKNYFLSFQRMREWIDLHQQMNSILQVKQSSLKEIGEGSYDDIHRSLTTGFLRNIGVKKEKNLYTGASGKEVMIFPGSGQFQSGPQWIVASTFLETGRLYALNVAKIKPEWLEALGGELCKFSWTNPRFHKKSGQVIADEKVSLFGLTIIQSRRVNFGRTNAKNKKAARSIFIQSALVDGNLTGNFSFLKHNLTLIQNWEEVENRLRSRNILVNDEVFLQFYDKKIPPHVYDKHTLKAWLRKIGSDDFLKLHEEEIIDRIPHGQELADFPPTLTIGSHNLQLEYVFEPGKEEDGVTLRVPFSLVEILNEEIFEWLVPGLIKEKTTFLLKSLPKKIRKHLVPLNSTVDRVLDDIEMYKGNYYRAVESSLYKQFQLSIKRQDWSDQLPNHLKMRFCLLDLSGKVISSTRNFSQLLSKSQSKPELATKNAAPKDRHVIEKWQNHYTKKWDFEGLPDQLPLLSNDGEVVGYLYPAISPAPDKSAVTIRFHGKLTTARKHNRQGLRYLFQLQFPEQYKALKRYCKTTLSGPSSLWLVDIFKDKTAALDSLLSFIVDTLFATSSGKIPTRNDFEKRVAAIKTENFFKAGKSICDSVMSLLRKRREVLGEITRHEHLARESKTYSPSRFAEYHDLLEDILPLNFLEKLEYENFSDCERYMKCLIIRISRAYSDQRKDLKKAEVIAPHVLNLNTLMSNADEFSESCLLKIREYEKLIQEMRVSLFSPELKTAQAVSAKKLQKAWLDIKQIC